MIVLGIETATEVCSVGLVSADAKEERSIRESRIHSERLLVLIGEVLEATGRTWKDVGGVALSSGPGSFTGLRIGASAAKGLCSAGNTPFISVPTFDALRAAYPVSGRPQGRLAVCLDAKQDEWYVQVSDGNSTPGTLHVLSTSETKNVTKDCTILTDDPARFDGQADVHDLREWCSGATVAVMGRERLLKGERTDIASFEPSYWKEFVVRTSPKRMVPSVERKEK